MKCTLIGVATASLLLAAVSFGENAPTTLSELERQVASDAAKVGQAEPRSQETIADYSRYRMEEEANRRILALSVMGMGLLSLFLVLVYLKGRESPPETIVNGSGLVLVVFATLLVVILAKAEQQLTASTGILGALAGYLFGRSTKDSGEPAATTRPALSAKQSAN